MNIKFFNDNPCNYHVAKQAIPCCLCDEEFEPHSECSYSFQYTYQIQALIADQHNRTMSSDDGTITKILKVTLYSAGMLLTSVAAVAEGIIRIALAVLSVPLVILACLFVGASPKAFYFSAVLLGSGFSQVVFIPDAVQFTLRMIFIASSVDVRTGLGY